MEDYYAILGVDCDASPESIKLAYRRLAREYHPDLNLQTPEGARAAKSVYMARLNEAYSVLSNARRRREYDERLRLQTPTTHMRTDFGSTVTTAAIGSHRSRVPRPDAEATVVSETSKHLRARLVGPGGSASWRETNCEGFHWALEASSWSSHCLVALRGFATLDPPNVKKLTTYAEIAIARYRRRLRKNQFLFLIPFQKLGEWETVAARCRAFVNEMGTRWPGTVVTLALVDITHGRTLRFGTPSRQEQIERLLQLIATPS